MDNQKHDKVVHTRVSRDLYDKISTKARKHRITTSNLLRNLVEDYLEIHGEVWDAIDQKLGQYLAPDQDSIIGYQTITLSQDTTCSQCGKTLKNGSRAFLGFYEKSSHKIITGPECRNIKPGPDK